MKPFAAATATLAMSLLLAACGDSTTLAVGDEQVEDAIDICYEQLGPEIIEVLNSEEDWYLDQDWSWTSRGDDQWSTSVKIEDSSGNSVGVGCTMDMANPDAPEVADHYVSGQRLVKSTSSPTSSTTAPSTPSSSPTSSTTDPAPAPAPTSTVEAVEPSSAPSSPGYGGGASYLEGIYAQTVRGYGVEISDSDFSRVSSQVCNSYDAGGGLDAALSVVAGVTGHTGWQATKIVQGSVVGKCSQYVDLTY